MKPTPTGSIEMLCHLLSPAALPLALVARLAAAGSASGSASATGDAAYEEQISDRCAAGQFPLLIHTCVGQRNQGNQPHPLLGLPFVCHLGVGGAVVGYATLPARLVARLRDTLRYLRGWRCGCRTRYLGVGGAVAANGASARA